MTPNGILSPDPDNTPLGEVYKWFGQIGCLDHLNEMKASAIAEATWKMAGIGTIHDPKEIASLLNWERAAKRMGRCLGFPYFDLDGKPIKHVRLKPEKPRTDKKSKAVKYEAPRGMPNRAYFPPLFSWQEINTLKKPVIVTEGEKKSLAACERGFVTIALSGVWAWKVKDQFALIPDLSQISWGGRVVCIAFDSDRITNEKIRQAEKALARILKDFGADVRIVELQPAPNGDKTGIDDFFVRGGTPEQFQALVDAARPAVLAHRREKKKDERTEVFVDVDEVEAEVTDQVIVAMANMPELYCRGDSLAEVIIADGKATVSNHDPAKVRMLISRVVKFMKTQETEEGESEFPVPPPIWCVQAVAKNKVYPGVKPLAMIVSQPVMKKDGSILTEPGYDPASELFLYWPEKPLRLPERPTHDDAKKAASLLLNLIGDFPIAEDCHRAGWLAALLTPVCRPAFDGPAPLFMVDANVRGAGKGKLLGVIALILTGRHFLNLTYPKNHRNKPDEAEVEKRITAQFRSGSQVAIFDDVSEDFGDAVLSNLLTASRWNGRILGKSEHVDAPATIVWYATGNNVNVVGDTIRRVLRIRLESTFEKPEERGDFRIKGDLMAHVLSQRMEYLTAALTILKAYHLAGRPMMSIRKWGSFEGWDFVRHAVVWCGLSDPGDARYGDEESSDEILDALKRLIDAMDHIDPKRTGLTSGEIVGAAANGFSLHPTNVCEDLEIAIMAIAGAMDARKLGKALAKHRRRVADGRLIDERMSKGYNRWYVRNSNDLIVKNHSSGSRNGVSPHSSGVDVVDVVDQMKVVSGGEVKALTISPANNTPASGITTGKSVKAIVRINGKVVTPGEVKP